MSWGDDDLRAMEAGAALPSPIHPALAGVPVVNPDPSVYDCPETHPEAFRAAPWNADQKLRHDATEEQVQLRWIRRIDGQGAVKAASEVARELADAVAAHRVAEAREWTWRAAKGLVLSFQVSYRVDASELLDAIDELLAAEEARRG